MAVGLSLSLIRRFILRCSYFIHALLLTLSTLTFHAACTDAGAEDEAPVQPVATVEASSRSTAELGVATWEVFAEGEDYRIVGRDGDSARRVEMLVQPDADAPEERARIETVFPEQGTFHLTRAGSIEDAASEHSQRVGAAVHADLGSRTSLDVPDEGAGSAGEAGAALAAPYVRLDSEGIEHLGWNLWPYSRNPTVGSWCRYGRIRSDYGVYAERGSTCWVTGWATNDLHDCRIRLHLRVGGGHWDNFHWSVYTR